MERKQVHLEGKQIRVLAHPLRARLLARLRLDGPATATKLAEALGTNTGATSYHLRQLADVGLVEEDESTGRGRERWWRSAHDMSSWRRDEFADDPDALAASDWLDSNALRNFVDIVESWRQSRAQESPEWRSAAGFSDHFLRLDAVQLTALTVEVGELIERHRAHSEAHPHPDARQVILFTYGVPRVDDPS